MRSEGNRPVILRFENVSKSFPRHRGHLLLRDHLAAILRGRHRERFQALKHVSFHVEQGESVAVVGSNGAGKSTLLALVAGLAQPDSGVVNVQGRVASLLELGSGFHGDLTGLENLSLNASLMGFSRADVERHRESIIEFAGLGDFIDEPLRTYSSGMVMRLAFAVAIHGKPDLLLIDEVLAVGDAAFQAKCIDKIRDLQKAGASMLCVSHGYALVQQLCDRAIWLDHGELVLDGAVDAVGRAYAGVQSSVSIA